MNAMESPITSVSIVSSTVCSGADQRKHPAPRHWPLWGESTGDPDKGPVTQKMFPFDDVIMYMRDPNLIISAPADIAMQNRVNIGSGNGL